jgi:hypothetical protein
MEIVEAGPQEYSKIIAKPYHVFGGAAFNHINEAKVESAHYLLFKDGKYRLGIVGGIRNNTFLSPFSAPFGGFSFLHTDIRISYIDEALQLLTGWAKDKGLSTIKITLPPTIYQESFLSKQINSLYRNNFTIEKTDLNYAYHLHHFNGEYASSIWYNARKNLKIALANNFSLKVCETMEEKETAYNIIRQNREARGFPLRMTWDQVKLSTSVIPADFFQVLNVEGMPVAAAVVFHVKPGVVQVIYWGDLPEYANLKTMNFLSFKIFEQYHQQQLDIIDIGPSTEDSIPNYGLCEFKEGIGCDISCKFSFIKSIA